ncbi:uncharacterized protein K444DRAFT_433179 [Hyaloscypha bicolor E]|uniref:Uncharacterized protein n=1 Tax=Hyaloscypha bicolor E TaxID=1095630 RepID=A0A2J6T637_9HELO|nr:uncharacterized protein K444DRAFT_433179 [Hyaloscypha bicolor E]PMD58482.1 hypothetical protein K444DRAFT_433179 [Hyaloscypha bicolor E]
MSLKPLLRSCPSAFSDTWVPLLQLWSSFTSRQPADSPHPLAICLPAIPSRPPAGRSLVRVLALGHGLCGLPLGPPQSADPSAAGRAVNQPSNSVNRPREGEGVDSSCSDLPLMLVLMLLLHSKCHSKIAGIDTRLLSPLIGRERKFLIQWIWRFSSRRLANFRRQPLTRPQTHIRHLMSLPTSSQGETSQWASEAAIKIPLDPQKQPETESQI